MADVIVYTISDPYVIAAGIRGVAAFFQMDSWVEGLIKLGLMVALLITLGATVTRPFGSLLPNMLIAYIFVMAAAFPKTTVVVEHFELSAGSHVIDDVPIMVAYPAAAASAFSLYMTEKFEVVFSAANSNFNSISEGESWQQPLKMLSCMATTTGLAVDQQLAETIAVGGKYCGPRKDVFEETDLYKSFKEVSFSSEPDSLGKFIEILRDTSAINNRVTPIPLTGEPAEKCSKLVSALEGVHTNILDNNQAADKFFKPMKTCMDKVFVDYKDQADGFDPTGSGPNNSMEQRMTQFRQMSDRLNEIDMASAFNVQYAAFLTEVQSKYAGTVLGETFRVNQNLDNYFDGKEAAAGVASSWNVNFHKMDIFFLIFIASAPLVLFFIIANPQTGLKLAGSYMVFGLWTQSWIPILSIASFWFQTKLDNFVFAQGKNISHVSGQEAIDFIGYIGATAQAASQMMEMAPIIMFALMSGSMYAMTQLAKPAQNSGPDRTSGDIKAGSGGGGGGGGGGGDDGTSARMPRGGVAGNVVAGILNRGLAVASASGNAMAGGDGAGAYGIGEHGGAITPVGEQRLGAALGQTGFTFTGATGAARQAAHRQVAALMESASRDIASTFQAYADSGVLGELGRGRTFTIGNETSNGGQVSRGTSVGEDRGQGTSTKGGFDQSSSSTMDASKMASLGFSLSKAAGNFIAQAGGRLSGANLALMNELKNSSSAFGNAMKSGASNIDALTKRMGDALSKAVPFLKSALPAAGAVAGPLGIVAGAAAGMALDAVLAAAKSTEAGMRATLTAAEQDAAKATLSHSGDASTRQNAKDGTDVTSNSGYRTSASDQNTTSATLKETKAAGERVNRALSEAQKYIQSYGSDSSITDTATNRSEFSAGANVDGNRLAASWGARAQSSGYGSDSIPVAVGKIMASIASAVSGAGGDVGDLQKKIEDQANHNNRLMGDGNASKDEIAAVAAMQVLATEQRNGNAVVAESAVIALANDSGMLSPNTVSAAEQANAIERKAAGVISDAENKNLAGQVPQEGEVSAKVDDALHNGAAAASALAGGFLNRPGDLSGVDGVKAEVDATRQANLETFNRAGDTAERRNLIELGASDAANQLRDSDLRGVGRSDALSRATGGLLGNSDQGLILAANPYQGFVLAEGPSNNSDSAGIKGAANQFENSISGFGNNQQQGGGEIKYPEQANANSLLQRGGAPLSGGFGDLSFNQIGGGSLRRDRESGQAPAPAGQAPAPAGQAPAPAGQAPAPAGQAPAPAGQTPAPAGQTTVTQTIVDSSGGGGAAAGGLPTIGLNPGGGNQGAAVVVTPQTSPREVSSKPNQTPGEKSKDGKGKSPLPSR